MLTVERETQASGLSYTLSISQFEDTAEAVAEVCRMDDEKASALRDALAPFEDDLKPVTGVLNAAQEQGAKQGAKEPIRKAIREHGQDSPEVQAEIEEHQKRASSYIIGAPRGSTGGLGKTKAAKVGKALLEKIGDEKLEALAAEYGIELEDLS
ncbi:MAG: hypothetical protein ACYSW3_28285 [Planctomycetota bacterium]|jgi:hypothetical protein